VNVVVKKRLNPGILIFDMDNRLSYANEEALQILPSLQEKVTRTKKAHLPKEILNLCDQLKRDLVDTEKTGISCSIIETHSGFSYSRAL